VNKAYGLLILPLLWVLSGCGNSPTASSGPAVIVLNTWNGSPESSNVVNGSDGFEITPYPGSSLSKVILWMIANQTGNYNYGLTVTDYSKSNSSIGRSTTGSVSIPNDSAYHPVTFTFSGNPGVNKGDAISFTVNIQSSPGGSTSGFCTQASSSGNTTIYETSGLGTLLGTGVAVVVYGNS
jgi:hypothetical protein